LVDAESPASAPEPARVQTAGRPPSNGSGGPKKTAIIIERLEKKPGTPIAELAQAAYGDATKQSQTKVRSLLAALKKQGRVKKMRGKKAGRWQIATYYSHAPDCAETTAGALCGVITRLAGSPSGIRQRIVVHDTNPLDGRQVATATAMIRPGG
jgi:DNA-binding transcriptional ArsR family regulator